MRNSPSVGTRRNAWLPSPSSLHRLAMARVKLVRTVEAQRLFDRRDAVFSDVDAGLDIARDGQADDIGHRAAADQRPARRCWKADDFLEPADHLLVHQGGGVIAAAEVGALDRGKKIAERASKIARAHIPGPEAGMHIAHRIGHHVFGDFAIDVAERLGRARQRGVKKERALRRHVAPDRALADVAQIADGVFDDPVRQFQRRAPILRIERFFGGRVHRPRDLSISGPRRIHGAGN